MMGYSPKSLEAITNNRQPLLEALAALHVAEVVIRYDGGGDSGDVSEVSVLPESLDVAEQLATVQVNYYYLLGEYREGQYHYQLESHLVSLDDALRDFALTWVDAHHGGWENNEGGAGVVTIKVAEPNFLLEHVEYYTESVSYDYSL